MVRSKTPLETAVQLLRRRDYSIAGLGKALIDKGYSDEEVKVVLDRLIRERFVDDLRFAEDRVRHLREKGKGRLYIASWLREHGLATEQIHAALEEGFPIEDEAQLAKKLLEIAACSSNDVGATLRERQRRYRRLVSSGFSREALEACGYGDEGT